MTTIELPFQEQIRQGIPDELPQANPATPTQWAAALGLPLALPQGHPCLTPSRI